CQPLSFFTHQPTTEIYTLSLHDALPISRWIRNDQLGGDHGRAVLETAVTLLAVQRHILDIGRVPAQEEGTADITFHGRLSVHIVDRKSTRLNSSHVKISYAVFCLKKKTK